MNITDYPYIMPSQRELLDMLSMGMSNQEIAIKLEREEGTVRNRIYNLSIKLNMNRVQLAVWWATIGKELYHARN